MMQMYQLSEILVETVEEDDDDNQVEQHCEEDPEAHLSSMFSEMELLENSKVFKEAIYSGELQETPD